MTQVKRPNSTSERNSRYVQGGTTERFTDRLGWWERRPLELADDDLFITISTTENNRPDLVAQRIYSRIQLTWLVLQYNQIVDITTEFVAGAQIRLPTPQRVNLEILNQPTGGRVTRR